MLVDAADTHEVVLVLVRDHDLLVLIVQHLLPNPALTWITWTGNSVGLVWVLVIGPERLLLQSIWNTTDNSRLLKWILWEMLWERHLLGIGSRLVNAANHLLQALRGVHLTTWVVSLWNVVQVIDHLPFSGDIVLDFGSIVLGGEQCCLFFFQFPLLEHLSLD